MHRWLAILVALGGSACHREVAGGAADGAVVFRERCTMCHGPTGKPDPMMVARLNVRDLTAPEFRARVTAALVEHQVRNGSPNKLMPSFVGAISDEQIAAVAAYVASPQFVH
jgi:mono/diheme cytochrome c family protein